MNRRDFVKQLGGGLVASAFVPLVAQGAEPGWLTVDSAAGSVTAHAAGRVRWRREGLGVPRAAIEYAGRIYVSDASGPVHVLDLQGHLLTQLTGFRQPWGLVARLDGLHVADRLRHHIEVVGWSGDRRRYGEGLNAPAGLAADGSFTWVADGGHARLVRLDAQGRVMQAILADEFWRPREVTVRGEHIIATSALPAAVRTFNRAGRLLSDQPIGGGS